MKEAAGEANMTVITIVLIAIVLGVGTVIVQNIMDNSKKRSCCMQASGTWENGKCQGLKPGMNNSYGTYKRCIE